MKNLNVTSLSSMDLMITNGGATSRNTFVYDLPMNFLMVILEFSRAAAEFQSSLPPNLKK